MNFDEARQLYNIEDILTKAGAKLKGSGRSKWCLCPLPTHTHHNYSPSFSVFWGTYKGSQVQRWKCHGMCNVSGDVIDLVGFMQIPGYRKMSVEDRIRACGLLTGSSFKISPPTPPPPVPALPQWLGGDITPPNDIVKKYILKRGILEDQIEEFNLGSLRPWVKDKYGFTEPEKWLAIPTFHGEKLMGIKLRNTGKGIRYMSFPGSKKGLWGYNDVYMKDSTVFIVKGELAAIIMRRFNFLSCAPTGGEAGTVDDIRNALILSRNIVIGDNDKSQTTNEMMTKHAENRALLLNADLYFPPLPYKDVDEWLLEDPEAEEAIRKWMLT